MSTTWPNALWVERDRKKVVVTYFGAIRLVSFKDDHALRYHLSTDEILHQFKLKSTNRGYWVGVKSFLTWLGVGHGTWGHQAYKAIRRQHHDAKAKSWDEALPPEIAAWAHEQIDRNIREHKADCADNSRCARKGNTAQMRRYKSQLGNGCCGFADWEAKGPDGKLYLLGYNYGH